MMGKYAGLACRVIVWFCFFAKFRVKPDKIILFDLLLFAEIQHMNFHPQPLVPTALIEFVILSFFVLNDG